MRACVSADGWHFALMMWTGWSRLIWRNFIKVAVNWIKICSLSQVGTCDRRVKFGRKIPNCLEKMPENLRGATFLTHPVHLQKIIYHCIQKWKYRRMYRDIWCVHSRYKYTAYLQVHAESATPAPTPTPQKTPRICANLMTHPGRGRVGTCPPVPNRGYATGRRHRKIKNS